MMKSETVPRINNKRNRASRARITPWQLSIEHHAMRLRGELNLSDFEPLQHDQALTLIPNCEVWPVKNIPDLPFEHIVHFRTTGYQFGAMAFRYPNGDNGIVFNDAHPAAEVRVHLMEEFFHIRLGHSPDIVRLYPQDGIYRTHNEEKEDEAYGSGIAALVPYGGLEDMLVQGMHIARIAEYFSVPIPVIEQRISVTRLGDLHLMPPWSKQMSLLARHN